MKNIALICVLFVALIAIGCTNLNGPTESPELAKPLCSVVADKPLIQNYYNTLSWSPHDTLEIPGNALTWLFDGDNSEFIGTWSQTDTLVRYIFSGVTKRYRWYVQDVGIVPVGFIIRGVPLVHQDHTGRLFLPLNPYWGNVNSDFSLEVPSADCVLVNQGGPSTLDEVRLEIFYWNGIADSVPPGGDTEPPASPQHPAFFKSTSSGDSLLPMVWDAPHAAYKIAVWVMSNTQGINNDFYNKVVVPSQEPYNRYLGLRAQDDSGTLTELHYKILIGSIPQPGQNGYYGLVNGYSPNGCPIQDPVDTRWPSTGP